MSATLLELWPHWMRPYWLLLLPLLAWLLWQLWQRQQRSGRWQALLPPAFHAALLKGGGNRRSRLPWIALGLAWLLAVLALLGPSWQRLTHSDLKPADPLVVMIELTPQMLASDGAPTRLEQAKRKLLDLLQLRRDAQTAIVVYAGSAHTLVPLSNDLATSRNLLESVKPSIMPVPGRRADRALEQALKLLDQAGQGLGRLLLITSALDEQEQRGIREALEDRGERLHILGVGSLQGAPILQDDGSFLKDGDGAILIPRLQEAGLIRLAQAVEGRYQRAGVSERDLRQLGLLDSSTTLTRDGEQRTLHVWLDQGHWLLLPLLLLAACAGRRGWLFCLPLLSLSLAPSAQALPLEDLWLRPDQQGQRLLQAGEPKAAAERFENRQWQAMALYQAGDYAAAAERFAENPSATGHYNRGNALARSNELEDAIEAYDLALELQPDLQQARTNKALVEQLLEQRRQAPPADSRDSEQEPKNQDAAPGPSSPGADGQAGQAPQTAGPEAQARQDATHGQSPEVDPQGEMQDRPQDPPQTERESESALSMQGERRQALQQWLRQIPDDPGELLRRKFWYQQQQRQEQQP